MIVFGVCQIMSMPLLIRYTGYVGMLLLAVNSSASANPDTTQTPQKLPPEATKETHQESAQSQSPLDMRYDWEDLNLGINLGGNFNQTSWKTQSITSSDSAGFIPDSSSSRTYNPSAFSIGGSVGYSWRSKRWVFGPELDFAWANAKSTSAGIPGCSSSTGCYQGRVVPGPDADSSSVQIDWSGSLRGKVGYLLSESSLLYVTGGFALGSLETSATCQQTPADPICQRNPSNPSFITKSNSETLYGYTAGIGFEQKISKKASIDLQYRFTQYAPYSTTSGFNDLSDTSITYKASSYSSLVTIGLKYVF
jgi:outer membrane immunogenic protein